MPQESHRDLVCNVLRRSVCAISTHIPMPTTASNGPRRARAFPFVLIADSMSDTDVAMFDTDAA